MIEKFLSFIRENGWTVEENEEPGHDLPEEVRSRYTDIPEVWLELIRKVRSMTSGDERTWFLCGPDYVQNDSAFQWNEWERLSLESAEGDVEWENEIGNFWDGHFPILLSVKNGYTYYAISMEDGSVVSGSEPEFEECRLVAASFPDFLKNVMDGKIEL